MPPRNKEVGDEETPIIRTKPSQLRNGDNFSHQGSIISESIWSGGGYSVGGFNDDHSGRIHSLPNNVHVRSLLEERVRQRLARPPGLRLIAHGIKVRPRPVWIQLHVDHNRNKLGGGTSEFHNCLTWRAELKSSSHEGTLSSEDTPCLGNVRKVSFTDILGFEVGQKTVALRKLEKSLSENECFSILTNTGTLDLQCVSSSDLGVASAEDVRRTLLNCFSGVLSSNDYEIETIMSARTNTNTISTVSF